MMAAGLSKTQSLRELPLYINGGWLRSQSDKYLEVINPATGDSIRRVPVGTSADVHVAVRSADAAFPGWRRTPPGERIQYLFRLKQLFEDHLEELARTVTTENGKTLAEARGELRRAIENIEVSCGIPMLMQGYNLDDVAAGIDESMIRQPLGVVAAITPFNFPAMIPFWFLPYAIACGNTFILKPSEKVPLTANLIFEIIEQLRLPPGVLNLVHGTKEVVNALLEHPHVQAVSFVGSTPVAKYVYAQAAANGKRAQCQGGAKNHVLVLPDADLEMATRIISESAFGCAGQRCLATSVAVTVGEEQSHFQKRITDAAQCIRVGNGLDESAQMGPIISRASKARIEGLIGEEINRGAAVLADGRNHRLVNSQGNFLGPTVLDCVPGAHTLANTEIFGPVLSLVHVHTLEEGIEILSHCTFGNQASIFTSSGGAARKFQHEVEAGNIGINIGVAAPLAYFPFSGWKESFFGTLHAQGRGAVEFYTHEKVVIERWPKEWTRAF